MRDAISALIRAVFWGSLTGGGPFLLLTIPIAITGVTDAPAGEIAVVALMPILIAGAVTAPAVIFLGLPLTALLAYLGRETQGTYVAVGAGFGLLIATGLSQHLFGGWAGAFLALFGTAAGAAAAGTWGSWRERIADQQAHP